MAISITIFVPLSVVISYWPPEPTTGSNIPRIAGPACMPIWALAKTGIIANRTPTQPNRAAIFIKIPRALEISQRLRLEVASQCIRHFGSVKTYFYFHVGDHAQKVHGFYIGADRRYSAVRLLRKVERNRLYLFPVFAILDRYADGHDFLSRFPVHQERAMFQNLFIHGLKRFHVRSRDHNLVGLHGLRELFFRRVFLELARQDRIAIHRLADGSGRRPTHHECSEGRLGTRARRSSASATAARPGPWALAGAARRKLRLRGTTVTIAGVGVSIDPGSLHLHAAHPGRTFEHLAYVLGVPLLIRFGLPRIAARPHNCRQR